MQQTICPIEIAQRLIDFPLLLRPQCKCHHIVHLGFARSEDAVDIGFLHKTEHMGIGLVAEHKTFGILQRGIGIGLQHGLERALRADAFFGHDVFVDFTVFAFDSHRYLRNQVVQGLLIGFGQSHTFPFAPNIVLVSFDFRNALCRRKSYGTPYKKQTNYSFFRHNQSQNSKLQIYNFYRK